MTSAIALILVGSFAWWAIVATRRAGRYHRQRDLARVEAQAYREQAAQIKRDAQRRQAATDQAMEIVERAVRSGDARAALGAVSRLSSGENADRLYDESTDTMLADAAAAAVARADSPGGADVRDWRAMLGRRNGKRDSGVGDAGRDLDDAG